MKRFLTLFLMLALFASAAFGRDAYEFFYELRVPKDAKFEPFTSFDFVTDSGSSSTRLRLTKRRDEGNWIVFADSTLVFDGDERRAMIVKTEGQPSQVFRLTFSSRPEPADWSKWRRPDYTEKTDAWWTFMHDLKKHDRSTNVPPDSFELRFKITESKSP